MSGICGCIHLDDRPVTASVLSAMTDAAAHRGPDGVRRWVGDRAGLAHLALHVTPEDTRESQPLVDDDLVLVADARIDNRADLRAPLRTVLHTATPTDADLILAAYRRWGTDCARHLIGDFAFAVWDATERQLFAARDPMGMRAFYYRVESTRLLFATEVKQLLAVPGVPRRLYEPMVAAYLAGNFNDLENTFYEGIRALPPAYTLLVTRDEVRTRQYWGLDPDDSIEYSDDRDYIAHFRHLFAEAVGARLHSVHPVGLFLSGGLDSGSVAAMAGHLQEENGSALAPLRTYSWAFRTFPECDERFISNHIVDHYGFATTAIDAEAPPLLSRSPYVGPDDDAPYVLGFHGLNEHALQRARADGVRCMLTGHRGDLVVGGWIFDYLRFLRTGQWRRLWRDLRLAEQKTGVRWQRAVQLYLADPLRDGLWPSGTAEWLRRPLKAAYRALRPAPPPSSPFPEWVLPDFAGRHASLPNPYTAPAALHDPMRRWRYETILMPSHMRVATLTERDGARHGLATADPWSDRRLVEFAAAVPPSILCQQGENKWIAREAMREIMPEAARSSAQKINPYPLYEHALKVRLHSLIEDILFRGHSSAIRGSFPVDTNQLGAYYHAYREGGPEDSRFWYTLTLALWLHHDVHPTHSITETNHEKGISGTRA